MAAPRRDAHTAKLGAATEGTALQVKTAPTKIDETTLRALSIELWPHNGLQILDFRIQIERKAFSSDQSAI